MNATLSAQQSAHAAAAAASAASQPPPLPAPTVTTLEPTVNRNIVVTTTPHADGSYKLVATYTDKSSTSGPLTYNLLAPAVGGATIQQTMPDGTVFNVGSTFIQYGEINLVVTTANAPPMIAAGPQAWVLNQPF